MPGFLSGPQTGFTDRSKGKGLVASGWLQQIGKSTAQAAGGGVVAGYNGAGVSPGTINNDNVLAVWTIPAGFFDIAGRGIQITASGSLGANANTKRIKLWFNASGSVGGTIGGAVGRIGLLPARAEDGGGHRQGQGHGKE